MKEDTLQLMPVVLSTRRDMRLLQSNIQSINTSKTLVNAAIAKHQVDVVLLQEVWKPSDPMIFKDYQKPYELLRETGTGGGVAIAAHKKVKFVRLDEYKRVGLEAVWAQVKVNEVKTVIGSVYINVGKANQFDLLDEVIEAILKVHSKLVICMDANASNSLWDNNSFSDCNYTRKKMGKKLEQIVDKHEMFVHNNGEVTYNSGEHSSAIDVTLSVGVCENHKSNWKILDDELRSPHSGILMQIGKEEIGTVEVIDWKKFDWERYEKESAGILRTIIDDWSGSGSASAMGEQVSNRLKELVETVGTKNGIQRGS